MLWAAFLPLVLLCNALFIGVEGQKIVPCGNLITGAIPNLKLWSSLYGSNTAGSITIAGANVLLDLANVTVTGPIMVNADASLYVDWQRNMFLQTAAIIVKGSFYIGTEDCPFENDVRILFSP
jgi:hypothetical protein